MLHFATQPDPVLLAILHHALELRRDELRTFLESGAPTEEWEIANPLLATHFSPSVARDAVDRLLAGCQRVAVHRPTEYLWLLLYDTLEAFCEIHNDLVAHARRGMTTIGSFEIGRIDFDALIDLFFWDTNFLFFPSGRMTKLTATQGEQPGGGTETFRLAAGLAPQSSGMMERGKASKRLVNTMCERDRRGHPAEAVTDDDDAAPRPGVTEFMRTDKSPLRARVRGAEAVTMRSAALVVCMVSLFARQEPNAPRVVPRGPGFDDAFTALNAGLAGDAVALQGGSLTSSVPHSVPVEIEYEVKGDGFAVQLGFAGQPITFQPDPEPTTLRIEGGPAGGQDVPGGGALAVDRFVKIKQSITDVAMEIFVDGQRRAHWRGEFGATSLPLSIANASASTLLVRAIRIRPQVPAPAAPAAASSPASASAPLENALVWRDSAFDDDFIAVGATRVNGAIVTRGVVESTHVFAPPIAIEYHVKTDARNVRVGYAAQQIIFNWETNPGELRIDGGPAGGRHVKDAGRIPENTFVTIRQVVRDDRMEVLVDGKRRAEWKARFRDVKQSIRLFAHDSTLTIDSIHVRPLGR